MGTGCGHRTSGPGLAIRPGCRAAPSRTATVRGGQTRPLPVYRRPPWWLGPRSAARPPDVPRENGEPGRTCRYTAAMASDRPAGNWNTFQNTASRPDGRSTWAALRVPATGSTQCQACPAMTRSNIRPPGLHSSKLATSTSNPWRRANSAIRSSTSTPVTRHPAAWKGRAEMPVPIPTSSTSRPGLAAMICPTMAGG